MVYVCVVVAAAAVAAKEYFYGTIKTKVNIHLGHT